MEKKERFFDWPTRIFHWLFAGLFVGAFAIAELVDDESAAFALHMLLGLVMVFSVVLRVVWGVIGSETARFSSFSLRPTDLVRYFGGLLRPGALAHGARNPASSWAAILMLGLAVGLGVTGYLMTGGGNKETFEDLHELLANAFLVTAIAHVAGVALHTLRHRDGTALSMLTGRKQATQGEKPIARSHAAAGLVFVALVAGFVFMLDREYDPGKQSLSLFGTQLQLGENDGGENGPETEQEGKQEHDQEQEREHDDD